YDPEHAAEVRPGLWRRFGDRVLQRPGPALAITVAFFLVGALGVLAYKVDYSTTGFFKKSVESVEGFQALESGFPKGVLAPSTVLVESNSGAVPPAQLTEAQQTLQAQDGVAQVTPTGETSTDGTMATMNLVLEGDPLKKSSLNLIPGLRDSVQHTVTGATV